MRVLEHKAKADRLCTCGARFRSRGDLRKHIVEFSGEQIGIGFAPHTRDFHQKKKPKA
jgi:hypothetical protein